MTFAGFCTGVAYFSTQCADLFGQWGEAAHPLCRQGTDVSAFTTHANTKDLQFRMVVLHVDHVIVAGIAYGRTGPTGRDAILILSCQLLMVSMHGYSSLKIPFKESIQCLDAASVCEGPSLDLFLGRRRPDCDSKAACRST